MRRGLISDWQTPPPQCEVEPHSQRSSVHGCVCKGGGGRGGGWGYSLTLRERSVPVAFAVRLSLLLCSVAGCGLCCVCCVWWCTCVRWSIVPRGADADALTRMQLAAPGVCENCRKSANSGTLPVAVAFPRRRVATHPASDAHRIDHELLAPLHRVSRRPLSELVLQRVTSSCQCIAASDRLVGQEGHMTRVYDACV